MVESFEVSEDAASVLFAAAHASLGVRLDFDRMPAHHDGSRSKASPALGRFLRDLVPYSRGCFSCRLVIRY